MSESQLATARRRSSATRASTTRGGSPATSSTAPSPAWLGTSARAPFALTGIAVQAKLVVGPVNDPLEREADRVAAHVTASSSRVPPPITRAPAAGPGTDTPLAQRAAIGREEDERSEGTAAPSGSVQRKAAAPGPSGHSTAMQSAAANAIASRGAGAPLDRGTRGVLESRLGVNLGDVRVHRGSSAEHSASALQARAFTHGRDVWLGRGESPNDVALMAHEVTHVLQQDGVVRRQALADGDVARPPDTPDEEREPEELQRGERAELEERRTSAMSERPASAETARPSQRESITPSLESEGQPVDGAMTAATSAVESGEGTETVAAEQSAGSVAASATAAAGSSVSDPGAEPEAAPTTAATAPEAAPAAATAPPPTAAEATAAAPAAAAPAVAPAPDRDPRFAAAQARLEKLAQRESRHPAPRVKVSAAEKATKQPALAPMALGKSARVDAMAETAASGVVKPKPESFLEMMDRALDALTPQTPQDLESFGEKGTGGEALRRTLQAGVGAQTEEAAGPIGAETRKEARPAGQESEQPIPPAPRETPAQSIRAADALPQPKSDADVSMEDDKQQADAELAKTGLSEEQLRKANEPTFTAAVEARDEVQHNSDAAPARYREAESSHLAGAAEQLGADEAMARAGMRETRTARQRGAVGDQRDLKQQRETVRAQVSADIQALYDSTKVTVEGRLRQLDGDVDRMFEEGQKAAFGAMKEGIASGLRAWKLRRYGGRAAVPLIGLVLAAGTWAYDKLKGIDEQPEVKKLYDDQRAAYVRAMRELFVRIADRVERTLQECRDEIVAGRERVRAYVAGLDRDKVAFGRAAAGKIALEFDALEQGVENKKQELAERMASRAKESREQVDQWLAEEKAKNKGLVSRLVGYVREIIETIRKFRERLAGILSKGKSALDIIIGDPIGFLGNIIDAVKLGFTQFTGNVIEHLKTGLFGWLFGTLASAGITLPKDFSLKSIFGLVLDVLGITHSRIRAKAVKLIGERNVAVLEKVWEFISALISGGPAGLWEHVKEFLSDLKDTVIEEVRSWVITNVVKAAVTKLVSMFNPIGAFIQAVLGIYNTVMFFIERINQILELVETVVSSVYDIATGKIASAANWIEAALGRTVPIIISFLARLLGLGGVSDKIKEIVGKLQAKVDAAIDKVINKVVGAVGKLFGKGKDDAAKKGETGDPAHDAKWTTAVAAVQADIDTMKARGLTVKDMEDALPAWKRRHGFKELTVRTTGEQIVLEGGMSPGTVIDTEARPGTETKPLSLSWYKPPSAQYEKLYFGGKTAKAITQAEMKQLRSAGVKVGDPSPREIVEYEPHARKTLPDGDTIGLTAEWYVPSSKPIGPAVGSRSPGGRLLNNALRAYGWRPTRENPPMDADHVREIQLGGVNKLENLWPLDATRNQLSGREIATAVIDFPGGGKKTMRELKDEYVSKGTRYFFKPDFK